MVAPNDDAFRAKAFIKTCLQGYEALELMDRAKRMGDALDEHLGGTCATKCQSLMASLGPPLQNTDAFGVQTFIYLPFVCWARDHGLAAFSASMKFQRQLTRRFTAEFSIRPYLEKDWPMALVLLEKWATDPDPHVRRLVSEGTRPRLPWASRLKGFVADPSPCLPLLETLKDDPDLYVRRSVANHLNDIGKDHPDLLMELCRRWKRGASPERSWIVRHALRSLLKAGDLEALKLMGQGAAPELKVEQVTLVPSVVQLGGELLLHVELVSTEKKRTQTLRVDLVVHYRKADGKTQPKVFRFKELELGPGERFPLSKKLPMRPLTTRRHHPGEHPLELQINGSSFAIGSFELTL